ncbi:MAG TPA: hypothetical protein VNM40_04010 [Candidatus Paceibacterota bacterium]|nr:hypothetical protein [Candidatus Paceibacterota bacterium]
MKLPIDPSSQSVLRLKSISLAHEKGDATIVLSWLSRIVDILLQPVRLFGSFSSRERLASFARTYLVETAV